MAKQAAKGTGAQVPSWLAKPRSHHRLRASSAADTTTTTTQSWGAKRARTRWRDWANLSDGPAGLIAERVLANYIRFRAACRPWRRCSADDPRTASALDRRYHPRLWIMLREELAAPTRRRFLNVSTGKCMQADLPELLDHRMLAHTPEGLFVLLHMHTHHVRLLNPLTPVTTLLPRGEDSDLSPPAIDRDMKAWGSGVVASDSTAVLCFASLHIVGIAKPGDEDWTSMDCDLWWDTPLMFAGRFYCVAEDDDGNASRVMVLETAGDQPPRLEVAAELPFWVAPVMDSLHLLDNVGELMLVHRCCTRRHTRRRISWNWAYDAYRVVLGAGALTQLKSLGGRAVFMGMHCSISVSMKAFPSITGDTIDLGFDDHVRLLSPDQMESYRLSNGSAKRASYNLDGSVPSPHTIVDCLSLSISVLQRSDSYLASLISAR